MVNSNAVRAEEIKKEMEAMCEALSGCDWCCGGGNERYQLLQDELEILENDNG